MKSGFHNFNSNLILILPETRLKYDWFHLTLYSMFQDLSRRDQLKADLADLSRGSNSLNPGPWFNLPAPFIYSIPLYI